MFYSGMPAAYLTTPFGERKLLECTRTLVGGRADDAFKMS